METKEQALYRLRPPLSTIGWSGWDSSVSKMTQLARLQLQSMSALDAYVDELLAEQKVTKAAIDLDRASFDCLAKRGLFQRIVAWWKGMP